MDKSIVATTGSVGTNRRAVLRLGGAGAAALLIDRALQLEAFAHDLALQEGLLVFQASQAATIEAMGARIWPGSKEDPGAKEAGTVYYIDRALAGAYAAQRNAYITGIRDLNAAAVAQHGSAFHRLDAVKQDAMLTALDKDELKAVDKGKAFFEMVRKHTLEGQFADPIYGGNRDFAGWKAVGYPGPYYIITAEAQQSLKPLTMPYQSIVDL